MEEFVDALFGGAVWGTGFAAALGLARSPKALRPVMKRAVKGAVSAADWLKTATQEGRETLQDLYHEAKAEQQAKA